MLKDALDVCHNLHQRILIIICIRFICSRYFTKFFFRITNLGHYADTDKNKELIGIKYSIAITKMSSDFLPRTFNLEHCCVHNTREYLGLLGINQATRAVLICVFIPLKERYI